MVRLRFLLLTILVFVLNGCGCGSQSGHFKIGIDREWYPVNFGSQQSYVNGFTEDFLMEIARQSRLEFELLDSNWDTILEDLKIGKYDAILTSLSPYPFHLSKYDFSQNFLDIGPVLIVPANGRHTELSQMKGEIVGLIAQDPAELILQKYPDVVMRDFSTIPDLLNAVAAGEIEGALLNKIPAVSYVNDLYIGTLKIASDPLTDAGLHLIARKGKGVGLVKAFDKSLDYLKKKKKLKALLEKWNLSSTN